MKKILRVVLLELLIIIIISSQAYCFAFPWNKKGEVQEETKKEKEIKEKDYLILNTKISYSAGEEDNWAYGNQRKEFPKNKACYARVSSTALYDKFFGDSEDVEVEYKISGFKNCKIDISDGTVEKVSSDNNIIIYKKTINANKRKNLQENLVVFKYTPNGLSDDEVTLEVKYGKNVEEKYDKKSTIYIK